jgi:hypothetical protein
MKDRPTDHRKHEPSAGTQVVATVPVRSPNGHIAHPIGSVGVVAYSPGERGGSYRIRFVDGFEAKMDRDQFVGLAQYKQASIHDADGEPATHQLFDRVIYQCIVGSRAFGLDHEDSDTDRRGIYLPPAELHWSLNGVPEQLERDATQECYWELQKFIVLALKGSPNILECLYTPIVEHATPLAIELLDMRDAFVSKLVFQTYCGCVTSGFKRIQVGSHDRGGIRWKHAMHLIRLLLSGIHILREGGVSVHVGSHCERLMAIRAGEVPWSAVEEWRSQLQAEFAQVFAATSLPDRPDYERANQFLIRARRAALGGSLP